jgi:diadenosine tetraphosphatase ApaH/serine/threonine PP2A family protein phosphatase
MLYKHLKQMTHSRWAIFSDVHANLEALQAVLADMEGVERRFCLGDTVGYAANPSKCLEEVRRLNCPVLMGNHDEAVASHSSLQGMNAAAQAGIEFSRRKLTAGQREWLANLPLVFTEADCQFVHGSLSEPWDYILDPEDAWAHFSRQTAPLCFCGHSHRPMAWHLDDAGHLSFKIGAGRIQLPQGGKALVNVGSVGQPRDRNPHACYVIYEPQTRQVEFRRVPYDIVKTQTKILKARLPEFNALRLAEGR